MMLGQARDAVHRWATRRWQLGPSTEHSNCTVTVSTSVQWQHVGASVGWTSDAGGRHAWLRVGPLDVHAFADPTARQLRREQLGHVDRDARIVTRAVGGRQVHGWFSGHEVGLSVSAARMRNGLHVRGLVGPLGYAVEPAEDASPQKPETG